MFKYKITYIDKSEKTIESKIAATFNSNFLIWVSEDKKEHLETISQIRTIDLLEKPIGVSKIISPDGRPVDEPRGLSFGN